MRSVELKRYVRWADADAAGRLYFPRIFDYFGEGERELLSHIGLSEATPGERYDFPRVHVECQFHSVLELFAKFTLRVSVGKLGRTSIRYDFLVFSEGDEQHPAAQGSVMVVVTQDGKPVEIPPALRAALSP